MAYLRKRASSRRRVKSNGERVKRIEWIDPFPGIMGTKPEKMVMAELYKRQVPFYFQYNYADIPFVKGIENWRLDFYVPSTKIVIEVNGDYWHTKGDAPAKDAFRYAALEMAGNKVVVWWESDILVRLQALFESEPLLDNPPVKGPPISMVNDNDDLRAMRRIAGKRRSKVTVSYARSRRKRRTSAR